MHVTLMHNPGAGDGQPSREALEAAVRRAGHHVSYQSTKEDGYGAALGAALEAATDLVVAAGGDGTVEKIARRIVGRDVPMAVLPLGTANNIATSLGVTGAWQDLVAGWAGGRPTCVDVGWIRTPWAEGYFLEGAGLGLLADAIVQADAREDHPLNTHGNPIVQAFLVPLVLGMPVSGSSGVIQVPGEGYRMSARHVLELCKQHEGFRKALFGYSAYSLHLASRSVACNAFHSIVQRLARWLLFAHDRAGKDEFRLTHEVLSAMLAATRPRVSQAAAKLKAEGIIDYRHGNVRILERGRLEAVSCECYEATKRLLPVPRH